MSNGIEFLKGHCGWDAVTLIPDGQLAPDQELAAALKILDAPLYGGLEVGFLGRAPGKNTVSMRIVSSTQRDWIPMCGGMTQVVGKALWDSSFRERFGIEAGPDGVTATLLAGSGAIPLEIAVDGDRVVSVVTRMRSYVEKLYRDGVEEMVIDQVPLLRVGDFAIFDIADLAKRFPGLDFSDRKAGPALDAINPILVEFARRTSQVGVNGMLYDDDAQNGRHFRVYPRFWSDDMAAAQCPWEFQCGTGSIAIAVALHHRGRIDPATQTEVVYEWGNAEVTPDPYGIRTSRIEFAGNADRLTDASFSHSHIEILQEGRVFLPAY